MSISHTEVERWWDAFDKAWATQDVEATTALFTKDATYQERWYAEPVTGQDELVEYWRTVARTTTGVRPGHDIIAVVEDMVVARWWVTFHLVDGTDGAGGIALEGIALVDHADDGRARQWREWFDTAPSPGTSPSAGTSALPAH